MTASAPASSTVDPGTRVFMTGAALVGLGVGIAALILARKASASTSSSNSSSTTTTTGGQAVSLTAADASTLEAVTVGDSVTISLPISASAGYSYPAAVVSPAGILGPAVRSSSATGLSDTFAVLAAGNATVTYTESTPSGAGPTTTFQIAAA